MINVHVEGTFVDVHLPKNNRNMPHEDLTYEIIERKYLNYLCLHGHLLIEHGLDTIN